MKHLFKKTGSLIVFCLLSFLLSFLSGSLAFSGISVDKNYFTLSKIQETADTNSRFIQQFTSFDNSFDNVKWEEYTKTFNDRYSKGNYATIFRVIQNVECYSGELNFKCSFSDCVVYDDNFYNYNRITLLESFNSGFSDMKELYTVYIPSYLANKIKEEKKDYSDGYSSLLKMKIDSPLFSEKLEIRGVYNEKESVRPNCLNKLIVETFGLDLIVSRETLNLTDGGSGCVTFGTDLNVNLAIHDFLAGRFSPNFKYFDNSINNSFCINNVGLSEFYNNFEIQNIGLDAIYFVILLFISILFFVIYIFLLPKLISRLKKEKTGLISFVGCVVLCLIVLSVVAVFSTITPLRHLFGFPIYKNSLSMWYSFLFTFGTCLIFLIKKKEIEEIKAISSLYSSTGEILKSISIEKEQQITFKGTKMSGYKKAIVFSRGIDNSTAGGQRTISDALCLSNLGYDVYLSGFINSDKSKLREDLKYLPWPNYSGANIFKKYLWFGTPRHIIESIKKINGPIDVILIYSVLSISQTRFLVKYCKKHKIKLVFDIVEFQNIIQQNIRSFFSYYLPNMYINKIAINRNHYVIAISDYLYNYFDKKRIRVVKLPFINLQVTKSQCKKTRDLENIKILLYAGSPGRKDDLFFMVNAYSNLSERDLKKSRFIIVGPNAKLLYKIGIDSSLIKKCLGSLILINKIPFETLEKIYYSADFSVLFKNNRLRHAKADFPSKVSQCLSYGIPLIANISSDLQYFLKDSLNSCICEINDLNCFTKTLSRAINSDEDTIISLKNNSLKTAETKLSMDYGVSVFDALLSNKNI